MFLIKNYYSFPLMHSQYFSNCLSDHSGADVLQAVAGPTPICHYFYFFISSYNCGDVVINFMFHCVKTTYCKGAESVASYFYDNKILGLLF